MSLDEAIKQFNTILIKKKIIAKYEATILNSVRIFEQYNYVLTEVEFDNFINSIIKGGNNAFIINAFLFQSKKYIMKYLLSNGQLTPEHFTKICKCYNKSTNNYNEYDWLFVLHKQGYKFDDEEKFILCQNIGLKTVINFLYSIEDVTVDDIKQLSQYITKDVLELIISRLKTEPVSEDVLLELINIVNNQNLSADNVHILYSKILTKKYEMTDKVLSVFLSTQHPPLYTFIKLIEYGAPITNDHIEILINRGYYLAIMYTITKGAYVSYRVRSEMFKCYSYKNNIDRYVQLPAEIYKNQYINIEKFNELFPVKYRTVDEKLEMLLDIDNYDAATELIQENSITINQQHLRYVLQSGKKERIKFVLDYRVVPEADTLYNCFEKCDEETVNMLLHNGLNVDIKILRLLTVKNIIVENIDIYNIDFEDIYKFIYDFGGRANQYQKTISNDKRYQLREMFRNDNNDINEILEFAKEHSLQLDGYCFLYSLTMNNNRFKLNEKLTELGYIPPLICVMYVSNHNLTTAQQSLLNLHIGDSKLSDPLKSKLE